ncbi:ABC transporter substrate-binding protein [Vibrio sp.]|nr:ABC transporter substrate-binding protein [Vibrio sp.]
MNKLLLSFLGLTLSTTTFAKDWKEIRFGVEGAYPPFSWTASDGSIQGFDVDLAYAICEEMEVKCRFVPQDWDGMIPALMSRKYDAIIAAMSITEERKKKIDFTDKYAQIPNKFAVKKGASINFDTLKGVKIGVLRAATHDKYVTDNYPDAKVVRYGSLDDAYIDLKAGRVQAVLGDASAIEGGLLNKEGGENYQYAGPSLTDARWFGEGMGIALRKQDRELKQKINKALAALRENGQYENIASKYFAYDIYGD